METEICGLQPYGLPLKSFSFWLVGISFPPPWKETKLATLNIWNLLLLHQRWSPCVGLWAQQTWHSTHMRASHKGTCVAGRDDFQRCSSTVLVPGLNSGTDLAAGSHFASPLMDSQFKVGWVTGYRTPQQRAGYAVRKIQPSWVASGVEMPTDWTFLTTKGIFRALKSKEGREPEASKVSKATQKKCKWLVFTSILTAKE